MLLTEEEARTKWCPHVRAMHEIQSIWYLRWFRFAINRGRNGNPAINSDCIASQCSQWRWSKVNMNEPKKHQKGFCGLAGVPIR